MNLNQEAQFSPVSFSKAAVLEDMQALNTLLESQRLRLTRFVRKHLKNEDHIDDVVQQTCLEAFRNWDNFRGESRPETWLFGIAFNLMRNFRSRQYKADVTFEPIEECHLEHEGNYFEQPMHMLLRREQMDRLARAIDQLPVRMQPVVKCVFLEDMSYQDAAIELGLPVGTIRSRLSRARDALRDLMLDA